MEQETRPDKRVSMFLVGIPSGHHASTGTMNAIARSRPFVKSITLPFDHLALRYALSDISKLEPLKYFPRGPPRWRGMEVRDIIPPSENASGRANETHCIETKE
jgi:hypothetical protein